MVHEGSRRVTAAEQLLRFQALETGKILCDRAFVALVKPSPIY